MKNLLLVSCVLVCGACEHPDESGGLFVNSSGYQYHWRQEQFAIKVLVNSEIGEEIYAGSLTSAVNEWNEQMGGEPIFSLARFDKETHRYKCGEIYVEIKDVQTQKYIKENHTGFAIGNTLYDGTFCTSYIALDLGLNVDYYQQVFMHELGHALGLTHDENNKNSVMYPTSISQNVCMDDILKIDRMRSGTWEQYQEVGIDCDGQKL